jgi:hypothetical protein
MITFVRRYPIDIFVPVTYSDTIQTVILKIITGLAKWCMKQWFIINNSKIFAKKRKINKMLLKAKKKIYK